MLLYLFDLRSVFLCLMKSDTINAIIAIFVKELLSYLE